MNSMIFILIIVLRGGHGIDSISQEFNTEDACNKAKTVISKQIDSSWSSIISSGCFAKGQQ